MLSDLFPAGISGDSSYFGPKPDMGTVLLCRKDSCTKGLKVVVCLMGKTSKSPLKVIKKAHDIGLGAFEEYSHPKSPQKFTQPQLFACLVLKAFFQTDYRGIEEILLDLPNLVESIGMKSVPHFTTLQKAEKRLLDKKSTRQLLQQTIEETLTPTQMRRIVELAAIDGSGFESRHVSRYFVKRRWSKRTDSELEMSYSKYPMAGIVCDCANHMILAIKADRGPKPDIIHFKQLLKDAAELVDIRTLLADAQYDSERSHEFAREFMGIESIIPPKRGERYRITPKGKWRRTLKACFPKEKYGQRWQVETVFSMIKRLLGAALKARKYHSQCRELHLRAIAHNIMILRSFLFYR